MTDSPSPQRLAEIRRNVVQALASLPERVGRYRIAGELGRGGMGVVYDAFDPHLDRAVAVKVLSLTSRSAPADSPDLRARFEREMLAMAGIFHPNVVSLLDAGFADDGRPYYVMERVEGLSLEEVLVEHGVPTRAEGLRLGASLARGLSVIHAHGLVHRDLKPSNILLPESGEPKISDFGLCELIREGSSRGTALLLGSAHYMAPEQVRGGEATVAADLFALGIVLVRIFSGVEPFDAPSFHGHLQRILHDEPDGIDTLDGDLRALVERLVAKDPQARLGSAAEAAEILEGMARAAERAKSNGARRSTARRVGLWSGFVLSVAAVPWSAHHELEAAESEVLAHQHDLEQYVARYEAIVPALRAQIPDGEPPAPADGGRRPDLAQLLLDARSTPDARILAYEVAGARNRVALARRHYNDAATLFNRRLRQLPWSLVAGDRQAYPLRTLANATPEPGPAIRLPFSAEGSGAERTRLLLDRAKLLSPADLAKLEKQAALLRRELAVDLRLVLQRVADPDLARFASRALEAFAPACDACEGRAILIVYDTGSERLRVEVSFPLEEVLPDAFVGGVVYEHARYLFDAGEPAEALLYSVRMLRTRLRDHGVGLAAGVGLAGGGGATSVARLGRKELVRWPAPRPAPGDAPARFAAMPTPSDAYERYREWLAADVYQPDVPLFTRESREFLVRFPMTPGYFDSILLREYSEPYQTVERGRRALVYLPANPSVAPHFLVRGEEGWQMDLVAEVAEVRNISGGSYTWGFRDRSSEALALFTDLVVLEGGVLRLRD
jgi:serine/threonine protein kinase